jgi:YegS/Rv2252/BmrU family lipid kinase
VSKKFLFIINPYSGTKKKEIIEVLIHSYFSKSDFNYEIAYTQYKGHATELAKEAANMQYYAVVAVGGDGSVNEVAQALVQTNTALGIIPAGSGNGLARHLKIPINYKKAIEHLLISSTKLIDTAMLNNYFFVGIAGIGFEALVAWTFAKSKKRGFLSYIRIAFTEWQLYKPIKVTIETEMEKYNTSIFSLAIANSSQYGNNAYISPLSAINDGFLERVIIKKINWFHIPLFIYYLFCKKIYKSKQVETNKIKSISLSQSASFAHIDGEPVEIGNNIQIVINPSSLNVIY